MVFLGYGLLGARVAALEAARSISARRPPIVSSKTITEENLDIQCFGENISLDSEHCQ